MEKIGKNDLLRIIPQPPLPMPQHMRDVFELLSHYDQQEGLDGLIQRLDMTGATRSDIYRIAHQRAPELEVALDQSEFDPHETLLRALLSAEFRGKLLRNLLRAYPEKRRDVYFHVPKCAGTDLTLNLAPRRASVPALLAENGTNEEALVYVSRLCRSLRLTDDIFIYGHIEFGRYLDEAGVRLGDRFFTVIRDPIELMISQVSDALSQVVRDPQGQQPDSRLFLDFLGLECLSADPTPDELKELWVRGLLDPRIAQPNRICTHLGSGGRVSYATAITNIVTHDIEVTTVPHYSSWLRQRWNLNVSTRHNASERLLFPGEVKRFLLNQIWPAIVEDEKLYRVINWALSRSGQTSITGQQIGQLAGSRLLDDLPDLLMRDPIAELTGTGSHTEARNLVVAQTRDHLARFNAPFPVRLASQADDLFLEIDFGTNGNARTFLVAGWARGEPEFNWTNAVEVKLNLPRPIKPATSLLFQAMVYPFREAGKVSSQSVEMLIGQASLARGTVHEPAILECEIPWSLIAGREVFEVTFRLPDAARPIDLGGASQDQRLLGLAFRWVRMFSLTRNLHVRPVKSAIDPVEPALPAK